MVLIILVHCQDHQPDCFHVFQVYHHRDHHCQQHHNDNIGSVIFTILIIFMFSTCKSLSNGEWHTKEYSGQKNLVGGNMERGIGGTVANL